NKSLKRTVTHLQRTFLIRFYVFLYRLIYLNNNQCRCNQQITEQGIINGGTGATVDPRKLRYNQQITEQGITNLEWKQNTFGLHSSPGLLYNQPSALVGSRTDVASVTSWSAPIIWEGTFDSTLIDSIYKQQNLTIATTVFALGKYVGFVKDFLESAEQHYFVGFRVHYYLFTDQPELVPEVKMGENHTLTVRKVQSLNRWQDISMGRMEKLEKLIENELASNANYIFCLDIDTKFYGHWGVESLGRLVGVIHPWLFDTSRDRFTYERRPKSQAYIPAGEGDYYYAGAAFGGSLENVHNLTKTCREQMSIDVAKLH
ncbi:hypothetical protein cypCar_00012762, partial [Cyprinus carpio]